MTRSVAAAPAVLLLVLGLGACSDEAPETAAAPTSTPTDSPPSSAAPDRAFADPTAGSEPSLDDYAGLYQVGNRTVLPCRTTLRVEVLDIGSGLAQVGSVRRGTSVSVFSSSVIFEDAEVVDGRWTGYLHDGGLNQCTSAEVRMEFDVGTARLAFYDENNQVLATGAARRKP